MRLVVSSQMTIFTCLCVGSPSTLMVSMGIGMCALMLSSNTVSDIMIDILVS